MKLCLRAFRRPGDPSKIIGPPWTEEVARDLTALGGIAVVALITLAVTGYLLIERRYGSLCCCWRRSSAGCFLHAFEARVPQGPAKHRSAAFRPLSPPVSPAGIQ